SACWVARSWALARARCSSALNDPAGGNAHARCRRYCPSSRQRPAGKSLGRRPAAKRGEQRVADYNRRKEPLIRAIYARVFAAAGLI
ncbi:hypothetical protein, partial [Pseudomonas aeruginosa]|uniref:hypothetical protein n=2 Tax=Pseudomonas aeruginosa TaxID=287 RepID=UPI0039697B8E